MIPVVLAGGSGTRLWPLSRTAYPKQFQTLNSRRLSMLQETVARLKGLADGMPLIICNEEHRFLVAEQLRQQNVDASILLEPVGRNTAPAIALAAFKAMEENQAGGLAPVLLILSADHVIKDVSSFRTAVRELMPDVEEGRFGTLGVVPTEPATGYGYIRATGTSSNAPANVQEFTEKPDRLMAEKYLSSGEHYWNSGMFIVRADRYLAVLEEFRPDIYKACEEAMQNSQVDHDFFRVGAAAFQACPSESIDYAIMEPLTARDDQQVVMMPLDAGWSDVGSWTALWDIADKDRDNNAVLASGKALPSDVLLHDTKNCLISASTKLVATLGVDDLVIVDTADALLVAKKDRVQDVKNIVTELKTQGRREHQYHREVYRPWGKYDSIDSGYRYQVKRITVEPGRKLSMQMHHHRAEHWIVVSGTAKVTNGEQVFLVTENESTYISIGQIHCLENPGVIPLEMIEVQSGSYLGEDDIVRLKDQYGRV